MNADTSSNTLIVVGCSAGGFDALMRLLPAIPAEARCAFAVVLHLLPEPGNKLVEIFASHCKCLVKEAEDKESIEPGTIYFAPAGYHLLVESDRSFSLSLDEPVLFSRPSIDVLFESAALALKQDVTAVLLSGANSDGSSGVRRVLDCGGYALIQEPGSAHYPAMPEAALMLSKGAPRMKTLNLDELGTWFADLAVLAVLKEP